MATPTFVMYVSHAFPVILFWANDLTEEQWLVVQVMGRCCQANWPMLTPLHAAIWCLCASMGLRQKHSWYVHGWSSKHDVGRTFAVILWFLQTWFNDLHYVTDIISNVKVLLAIISSYALQLITHNSMQAIKFRWFGVTQLLCNLSAITYPLNGDDNVRWRWRQI